MEAVGMEGDAVGFARVSSGRQHWWRPPPGDKTAEGRTCRSVQIQHTPKLKPGAATNPSARFSVSPPDVPAPHPTPCTPPRLLPRHTLHLLRSLGTSSQTRPARCQWPLRASTRPLQHGSSQVLSWVPIAVTGYHPVWAPADDRANLHSYS